MAPVREHNPNLAIPSANSTQNVEKPAEALGIKVGCAHITRKKPGRPRTLTERAPRKYIRDRPIIRPVKTYSRDRKIQVLEFLVHHRVIHETHETPLPTKPRQKLRSDQPPGFGYETVRDTEGGATQIWRPPTYQEAGDFWKINPQTISNWWKTRDRILGTRSTARSSSKT